MKKRHTSSHDLNARHVPDRDGSGEGDRPDNSFEGQCQMRRDHPSARDRFWSQVSPTGERPQSALNLRIALAIFGLVVCGVFAALAAATDLPVLAAVMGVLALIAVIDLVVVIRRRAKRSDGHSLFG